MLSRTCLYQCSKLAQYSAPKAFPSYTSPRTSQRPEELQAQREKRQRRILHRLYTEHDVSKDDILDAYMCGTQDKILPKWVYDLPSKELSGILDGKALGLQSFDFATHQRLEKLPFKKRILEWEKIKLAQQYEKNSGDGHWQNSEHKRNFIRNSNQVYHRNLRTRYRKMANFRRELRGLDQRLTVIPTDRLDLSYRFARAAQMVLQGHQTKGMWPPESAMRAESAEKRK